MCTLYQKSLSFILPLKSNSSGSSLLLESDPSLDISLNLGDPRSCMQGEKEIIVVCHSSVPVAEIIVSVIQVHYYRQMVLKYIHQDQRFCM